MLKVVIALLVIAGVAAPAASALISLLVSTKKRLPKGNVNTEIAVCASLLGVGLATTIFLIVLLQPAAEANWAWLTAIATIAGGIASGACLQTVMKRLDYDLPSWLK